MFEQISGSFATTYRFETLAIRKVFLRLSPPQFAVESLAHRSFGFTQSFLKHFNQESVLFLHFQWFRVALGHMKGSLYRFLAIQAALKLSKSAVGVFYDSTGCSAI